MQKSFILFHKQTNETRKIYFYLLNMFEIKYASAIQKYKET